MKQEMKQVMLKSFTSCKTADVMTFSSKISSSGWISAIPETKSQGQSTAKTALARLLTRTAQTSAQPAASHSGNQVAAGAAANPRLQRQLLQAQKFFAETSGNVRSYRHLEAPAAILAAQKENLPGLSKLDLWISTQRRTLVAGQG
jgi:hypothetical protein